MARRSADETGTAEYCEVDPARGTLDAPTLCAAPDDDVSRQPFVVDVRGLPVSLRGFLQDLHVQSLLRHHLLQPSVLLLKRLQLHDHVGLHAPILLSPAIVRLLGDLNQLADLGNLPALAKLHVRSTSARRNFAMI